MEQKDWKTEFDSEVFAAQFHYDGPLGADCSGPGTLFRLWAPTAEAVQLRLYEAGEGGEAVEQCRLERRDRGLWQTRRPQRLSGVYYDYLVTVDGVTRRTADPYATACGRNGQRSMVIDLRETDPPGWREDKAPALQTESVIYELHVKDFSFDPASGIAPALRGKYLALTQAGVTLNGDGIHPTGLDYLKELGVTHIQLMPVFDYGSVDEGGPEEQFNWGYDPVNYNVPEGSYSTDPAHGEVRVRELKQAIQALHQNGFRVIMDVVYNHTYRLDSWLWRTVPWYGVRQNEDGTPSNGSGCGCDLATERSMCGKYILDSVLYWAEEYHMDGFRFDLMGLLDVPLMNRIRSELDRRWGRGEKLVFGEPWAAGDTACRPGTQLAGKDCLSQLDEGIGAFCDATRDAVKGSVMEAEAPGFVSGGEMTAEHLASCLKGWAGETPACPARSPAQTITYLSCHDDWTLWDKLVLTLDPERDFASCPPEILRANRLAAAINFCCQGYPFLLAGEEFARTKLGVKNSYASPPELNRMDWTRAWENRSLVEYYQGLIALRKQCPGLCEKSPQAAGRFTRIWELTPNCVGAEVDNRGDGPWQTLCLLFNASETAVAAELPRGVWERLADGESSVCWRSPERLEETVTVAHKSALILGRRTLQGGDFSAPVLDNRHRTGYTGIQDSCLPV